MSGLKLKDIAKENNERNIQREGSEDDEEERERTLARPDSDNSDNDIQFTSSGPSGSGSRRTVDLSVLPKTENPDQRIFTGPPGTDGNIQVRFQSQIDGYDTDVNTLSQMERMGLPTGFTFGGMSSNRTKKGDKKTFYCDVCMIELNSEDTMKSHIAGVKHLKKVQIKRQEYESRGERMREPVRPIANPITTKIKVPGFLQEKIRETQDPVIGLKHVREFVCLSDMEMDPHYECDLCGSKGIANGMFSHVMGHKHRQQVMKHNHPGDSRYIDRSQKECLEYAVQHSENQLKLSDLIKRIESDTEYPWPPGKAPWSIEQGGTGVPPMEAKENAGRNRNFEPKPKPFAMKHEIVSGLPGPSSVRAPATKEEAINYFLLAEKLMILAADSLSKGGGKERLASLTKSFISTVRRDNDFPAKPPELPFSDHRNRAPAADIKVKDDPDRYAPGPSSGRRFRNSRSPSPPRASSKRHRASPSPDRRLKRRSPGESRRRSPSPRGAAARQYSPPQRNGVGRPDYSPPRENGRHAPSARGYSPAARGYSPADARGYSPAGARGNSPAARGRTSATATRGYSPTVPARGYSSAARGHSSASGRGYSPPNSSSRQRSRDLSPQREKSRDWTRQDRRR